MKEAFRCLVLAGVLAGYFISSGTNCKSTAPVQVHSDSLVLVPKDTAFTIEFPFFSADGKKVYFFGRLFGREGSGLYEVDTAGGIAKLVVLDTLVKLHPRLSPDGKKVAYLAAILGRQWCCAHVWMMNIDGTDAKDLTPFGGNWEYVRWSPDGRYVIFSGGVEDSGAINKQIVRVDVQTGEAKLVTRSSKYNNVDATYMADGKKIAYSSGRIMTDYGGKVWFMDADGTNHVPIDTSPTASAYPRPSPTRIELTFFWGLGGESDAGAYRLSFTGNELPTSSNRYILYPATGKLDKMQWSPDGETICYPASNSNRIVNLMLVNRDGTEKRQLTSNLDVYLFN